MINTFWDKIVDIGDAGKRIYKTAVPKKVDDFTMSKLKARIRQEQHNTRFEGKATSWGLPLNRAKIELKPLAGGRKRVGRTKASGKFEVIGMAAGDYQVTVSAAGKSTIINQITIVTGSPLNKDFVLV